MQEHSTKNLIIYEDGFSKKEEVHQLYDIFGEKNLIKIDQSIEKISENQVNLFFNINEGEITKIGKINIIGNKEFSSRKIKSRT